MNSISLLTLDLLGRLPCYVPLANRAAYAADRGLIDWAAIEKLKELVDKHVGVDPAHFAQALSDELASRERSSTSIRKFEPSDGAKRRRPIAGVDRHFQAAEAVCDTPQSVDMRPLLRADMPLVQEIEFDAFEFPWTSEQFANCMRQRTCWGIVAELRPHIPGTIAGYMVYELLRGKIHLLNLAVAAEHRRLGVGRALIGRLTAKLPRLGFLRCEVRETNLGAQQFFRALGFKAVSVLRDYYEDTPEDSYVMHYRRPNQA